MSKKLSYSVRVIGTEDDAKVVYSKGMTHLQKYALLKCMLDDCFKTSLDGVPDEVKNGILDNMIEDARKGT